MTDPARAFGRIVSSDGASFARFLDDSVQELDRAPWLGGSPFADPVPLESVRLDCPVAPSKILGIGRNYRAHAKEMGGTVPERPLVFSKLPSSLLPSGGTVLLPRESARVDYEAELGVVIGRRARRVTVSEALDCVFGYTPLCDVTARDLQASDGQWTRAKGFDTFCPVGPRIVCDVDPGDLRIQLTVNGAVRQDGTTRDMVFGVAELVAYLSTFATLEPGDLIATGTPEGVGALTAGDRVVVTVGRMPELVFDVASAPD